MRKLWKMFCIATVLTFLTGCQTPQEDVPLVTPTETVSPTIEVSNVATPEPTVTPTEVPTSTPEPTATVAPQETLTPAPTEVAAPTATAIPTSVPHVHTWTAQETPATCTTDGSTVEVCDCGEQQNLVTIPATGHTVEKRVTKEATVEEEGSWEEVCTVCGEVVNTGSTEKVIPTATPVPTNTPTPTSTPTPVPTSTPTPTPTATPTPSPTPRPDPFEEYTWWNVNYELIAYTDETCTEVEIIDTGYRPAHSANGELIYHTGTHLANYSELKGEKQKVYVYDYPSHDANILCTIVPRSDPFTVNDYDKGLRQSVVAIERCLENGWYYVAYTCSDTNPEYNQYGFVDDEYMLNSSHAEYYPDYRRKVSSNGLNWEDEPWTEYCLFEMPYISYRHELEQPKDLTISIGEEKDYIISTKSENTYRFFYDQDLDGNDGDWKTVCVYTIENPEIADLKWSWFLFNEELGYFNATPDGEGYGRARIIGKSVGTTKVTVTEYEISNFKQDDRKATFDVGKQINEVSFFVTVTK